jgi:hypothetical protein
MLGRAYLVGFMIVLRIVFKDLFLFGILECLSKFLDTLSTEIFPPLFAFNEPGAY